MKNKHFFILILLLVIGFASISATLVINGNTKVAANLDDFNVIFIEGFLDGETNENVAISEDKKTLTFITNKLTNINETARIDYKVKNISTQYDGDVTINCTNESNEYVNVTSSFDGKNLPLTNSINMQAQEVKSGYINAELTKPTTEEQEIKVTCKIEVNATSRTNYAYSLVFDSDGGSAIDDKSVNLNDSYGELSVPTKEGYTFIGWFNEEDVMVGSDTVFDSQGNRNLHAKWSKNAYPVEIRKTYSDRTETSEINIPYGETIDSLMTIDEKYFIDNIECSNGYTIKNYNKDELIFGNRTITINNNSSPKSSTCTITVLQGIYEYSYTGEEQEFTVPCDGKYKIELWGAGRKSKDWGAYTSGNLQLDKSEKLYLYLGQKNQSCTPYTSCSGEAWNGGGAGGYFTYVHGPSRAVGGSGSTDVRLIADTWNNTLSLRSRIMVAGGGGASYIGDSSAGGLIGYTGADYDNGKGGTQIAGGSSSSENGGFGYGGKGIISQPGSPNNNDSHGGGGGYYGGGGGLGGPAISNGNNRGSGGGGSSFISGHAGCIAIKSAEDQTPKVTKYSKIEDSYHYSGKIFTNTVMVDGLGYNWTNAKGAYTGMPTHDGKSTMTGNIGDGYAKITYLGK